MTTLEARDLRPSDKGREIAFGHVPVTGHIEHVRSLMGMVEVTLEGQPPYLLDGDERIGMAYHDLREIALTEGDRRRVAIRAIREDPAMNALISMLKTGARHLDDVLEEQ